MKVYLSGPMTGLPDFNYPEFNRIAKIWRDQGNEVFNPAETFAGDTTRPRVDYMREDIAALLKVDAIVMLKGWEQSKGALLELAIAHELGLKVYEAESSIIIRAQPCHRAENILDEAHRLVHGERNKDYGAPIKDFTQTAGVLNALLQDVLKCPLKPTDIPLIMIAVKLSRSRQGYKRDTIVDIAGYAETWDWCQRDMEAS